MRKKLIKRFQDGGNTGNVGAIQLPKVSSNSFLPKIDTSPETLRKQVLSLKLPKMGAASNGTDLFQSLGGWNTVNMGTNILSSFLPETINSSGFNAVDSVLGVASQVPVVGKYATLAKFALNAINSLGGTTLDSVKNDQDVQDTLAGTGGGYGGAMSAWDEAKDLSGKRVGLFTNSSALNAKIHEANRQMLALSNIIGEKRQQDLLTGQMGDIWNQRTMNELNGGFGNISFGRLGLKIEILPKVHSILNKPKVVDTLTEFKEEIPEFKEGGKMNVIPEGSLHARLHHMENAEGLTKKGIPVVSIAEGGQMEQQAEIELNEIIFRLEVTQELEKLMEDGSDNAAIEAGKLLVKEIFENTDDRTGLLKSLEPEKKESTPEDIVNNHQVFQQGGILNKSNKTIEELVDYALKVNPYFVQRIGPNMGYAEFDDEKGKRRRGTHYLGYAEKNGKYVVYPQIQMKQGRLQYIPNWQDAFDEAWKNNNVISFDKKEDAEMFTEKYKESKQWKHHFDTWEQRYD